MGQPAANCPDSDNGSGERGSLEHRNEIQVNAAGLKAPTDNSPDLHCENPGGDSINSEATTSESWSRIPHLGSAMSTSSDEYGYDDDSDFDLSVHSEFTPISSSVRNGLRVRSKSTSDITEDLAAAFAGFFKKFNAKYLRLSQLWDSDSQYDRSEYGTSNSDWNEDCYSVHSDILPISNWNSNDKMKLFRSKSTSELYKYSENLTQNGLELTEENLGCQRAWTAGSWATCSDSEAEYDEWVDDMVFGSDDAVSSSMSVSNVEPFLSRGSENPNEFLMSIRSNPNLQRSFSFGDIIGSLTQDQFMD